MGIFFCCMLIINMYSSIISNEFGIPSYTVTIAPILFLVIINAIFYDGVLKVTKEVLIYLYIGIGIFLVHSGMYGINVIGIKYVLYLILFVFSITVLDSSKWKLFENGLIIISILMSFEAIVYISVLKGSDLNIYNVRLYTTFDKPVYTIMLTLSTICCFVNWLNKKTYGRIKSNSYLLIGLSFTIVNGLIIQSKLFLISMCIIGIVSFFKTKYKTKKIIGKCIGIIVVVGLVAVIFRPDIIPDYVYIFLNETLGVFGGQVQKIHFYSSQYQTYSQRNTIIDFCIQLFMSNPIVGIGFGNYQVYAISEYAQLGGVTETESSVLGLLVEGGLIYFSVHCAFVVYLFKKIIIKLKRNRNDFMLIKSLCILCALCLLQIGNDFYNTIYWIVLSYIYVIATEKGKFE